MSRTHLALLIIVICITTACHGPRQTRVLAMFFDGVPGAEPAKAAVAVATAKSAATEPVPELYLLARAAPKGFRHKPFADHECISCHESQFSEKLRGQVAEICQLCHQQTFAERAFAHDPVRAGRCLECHRPHQSPEPALLAKPERQLCGGCHAEPKLSKSSHATIATEACHVCHEAHGGERRFYLRSSSIRTTRPAGSGGPST